MKLLRPDFFMNRIEDIDLELLRSMGYKALIFDLDNTLVGWRSKNINPSVIRWLERAGAMGFKMCIVSNCMLKKRVRYFSELLNIPFICKATKPMKRAFIKAVRMMDSDISHTAVIGDQMFTDVLGGNRLGFLTVLVRPIDKREFYATLIQRTMEKIVLYSFRKRGLLFPVNHEPEEKNIEPA